MPVTSQSTVMEPAYPGTAVSDTVSGVVSDTREVFSHPHFGQGWFWDYCRPSPGTSGLGACPASGLGASPPSCFGPNPSAISDNELILPDTVMFWSVWNRRSASADESSHAPVACSGFRYPFATRACWISLLRSGAGAIWRERQVTGAGLTAADFFRLLMVFVVGLWAVEDWVAVVLAIPVGCGVGRVLTDFRTGNFRAAVFFFGVLCAGLGTGLATSAATAVKARTQIGTVRFVTYSDSNKSRRGDYCLGPSQYPGRFLTYFAPTAVTSTVIR